MRDYAQIHVAIWNDDDFRALTPAAQHLYFLLLSNPTLNYAGVGDWRPKRLAKLAAGWSEEDVQRAGSELIQAFFILVDEDTEEYLVRSFVRNDPLLKHPKLSVSMARAFAVVASTTLRGVIVHELKRLQEDFPDYAAWKVKESADLLEREAVDPKDLPLGSGWFTQPFTQRFTRNYGNHLPNGLPIVSGKPNPTVYPTTYPTFTHPLQQQQQLQPLTGGESGAAAVGVKGGTGGEGEGDKTPDATAPTPTPQNLDQLAAAHADRNRCERHKGLPEADVPPCRACQRARETNETRQQQADQQARQQRREAIDACPHCDQNGILMRNGTATRCNHTNPHWTPPKTRPTAPQNDKQDTP